VNMQKQLTTPLSAEAAGELKAGDRVLLSGVIYTARDAAHKRLVTLLEQGEDLPFDPAGAVIFYVGPTPPRSGEVIGSAGPTTSYRMDPYAPALMAAGVRGMVGKGPRSDAVVQAMQRHGAVYFAAVGGAAVVVAQSIVAAEVIAYDDLGAEAIRRLEVRDFPCIVAIDSQGNSLYR
jgi:fumarate hydratase subunit beta